MAVIYHPTPIGFARIEDDEANIICSVTVRETAGEDATEPSPAILTVTRQLDAYFAGERLDFDFPFRKKVFRSN